MPTDLGAGSKPLVQPAVKPPAGKPIGILIKNGFHGTIEDFNHRVKAVVDAHTASRGVPPSPGLVLAVARNTDTDKIPGLFRINSRGHARTVATLNAQGVPTTPSSPAKELFDGLARVRSEPELNDFLTRNATLISQALDSKKMHARFAGAYDKTLARISRDANPMLNAQRPETAGLVPDKLVGDFGLIGKYVGQIAAALLLGPPTLAVAEGRAVGKSVSTRSLDPLGHTNAKLAKAAVKGVRQDFADPKENGGYLFLDVLGLVSAGAGTAARVSAAGKALSEEGAKSAVQALGRRPVGGTATLGKGGFTEEQLLTENSALRWAQRGLVEHRNARMDARIGDAPGGVLSIAKPSRVSDQVDALLDPLRANFSSENKLGREAKARRRIEQTIQMTLKRELDAVAGWTQTASTAFQRINKTARVKGLTVGEQKAIQVLSTDDAAPVQAWRDFHKKMLDLGVGDPASHRAQLAALKLAEKALANPRPRFQKAIDATREVIAEQQRLKVDELGLLPDTADKRVISPGVFVREAGAAQSKAEIAGLSPAELAQAGTKQTAGSFYLPFQKKGKPSRNPSTRLESFSPQAGPGGIPMPGKPAELTHEFTGSSILAGDFRIDATNLAGEAYARTVKAATKLNEWKKLWAAAKDKPTDLRWERPIRDIKGLPDELRALVNKSLDAELTSEEAGALHPTDIKDLETFLFPGRQVNGVWKLDQPIEHVKWVDSRLIDAYHQPLPRGFRTTAQLLNEPVRDVTLLARPAYILNMVGNAAMGLVHQGVFHPPNLIRAIRSDHLYGEKVTRAIDALGGQSRSMSYAPVGVGEGIAKTLTTPGRTLARAWNVITDQMFRRAAIIHELRRQANVLKLDKDEAATYESLLFDGKYTKQRNEAVRRGNKAMVEFDNLTWLEREALRHLIFVYPWTSRALVWSIRTLVEHPVQSALYTQIGREAEDELPDVLKKVPEWFKQIGYVPIGYNDDGSPRVVNTGSVNTFATFAQLLYPLKASVVGGQYGSLSDLFGPGAQFALHASTGKDQYGNTYPGSQWYGAAREVLLNLPQLRKLNQKQSVTPGSPDLSDRGALVKQLNEALKQTVFTPGWLDGYGSLISGGLTPRGVNPLAAEARYYKDLPLEQKHAFAMNLIRKALTLQGGLLKKNVPSAVRDAVEISGDRQLAYDELKKQLGRTPTGMEQILSDIDVLQKHARMSEADAAVLTGKAGKISDPHELDRFRAGLLDKYAGAKDLQDWDERVRFVYSFRPEVLKDKLEALKAQGLVSKASFPHDQETLFEWGRKSLAYYDEAKQRSRTLDTTSFQSGAESTAAHSAFRVWLDQQDTPVKVGERLLPSPVAMAWSNLSPHEQQAHLRSVAHGDWSQTTAFDKKLVGVKTDPVVTEGWGVVYSWLAQASAQLPPGSRLPHGTKDAYAKAAASRLRAALGASAANAFSRDYQFGKQILAERLKTVTPVQDSPNRPLWNTLLSAASGRYKQLLDAGWKKTQIAAYWRSDDVPKIEEWVGQHPKFKAELADYGPNFIARLVR